MSASKQADLQQRLADTIETVPDFPVPEIVFKDITPVLADPQLLVDCAAALAQPWQAGDANAGAGTTIDLVAGIEARGFVFAPLVAQQLGCGFIPVRKPGKLPRETYRVDYELEYGSNTLEVHRDAAAPGQQILLIDDLLATGGTAQAALGLLEQTQAQVVGCGFVIDLAFLDGQAKLGDREFCSLLSYS